uniref:Sulfatase N-terminal domain-containing protein n=2 Tax=Medicago truncatula TaxID=3880 RepID=A0A0D9SHC5_MEDTR
NGMPLRRGSDDRIECAERGGSGIAGWSGIDAGRGIGGTGGTGGSGSVGVGQRVAQGDEGGRSQVAQAGGRRAGANETSRFEPSAHLREVRRRHAVRRGGRCRAGRAGRVGRAARTGRRRGAQSVAHQSADPPESAHAAAVRQHLGPRAEFSAARRPQRDFRQLLYRQHGLHTGAQGAAYRALQLSASQLGAAGAVRRFDAGDAAQERHSCPSGERSSALLGRWRRDLPHAIQQLGILPGAGGRSMEGGTRAASDAGPESSARQDFVNRQYYPTEDLHPQTLTFDAGEAFLRKNHDKDSWFLQIETFDPHEPFASYPKYRDLYPGDGGDAHFDWPPYGPVSAGETDGDMRTAQAGYAALVSMCDRSLGRVLDLMDELDLWRDTMLIVCTDHGYMLGEHGWWAKTVQPWFNELANTPLFIWDPRCRRAGVRRQSLVQMIDIAPTLLDFFGLEPTPDMQGGALRKTIDEDAPVREAALFGMHGEQVNVTDGRYVYMRSGADPDRNEPLYEYTLMPTHMREMFGVEELQDIELSEPFSFTKGVRTMKIASRPIGYAYRSGTLLFDLHDDPKQERPLYDESVELRMAGLMRDLMRANDAPQEQYTRLGL